MRVRFLALAAAALVVPACDSGSGGSVTPYAIPTPFAVPLSAAGPDQLQSVAAGPGGSFYAAGFAAVGPSDPKLLTVVKIASTGGLDLTFGGGDGIATTAVECFGNTDEVDVAVQPATGKIVVSTTIPSTVISGDRDIAVVRLNTDGSLDGTFAPGAPAGAGVRVLSLNDATDTDPGVPVVFVGFDGARGLAVDPANGLIYLHAYQRAEGVIPGTANPRVDTDFAVVRLTAEGDLDTAGFGGGDGKHLLDIGMANATARGLVVLGDGTIVAGGYANSGVVGWTTTVQPVVYKLSTAGVLVPAFGAGGLYHQTVWGTQTEVYGFAVQGTNLVTAGYGRESGVRNDWVSLRFDAATGARDLDWGGAPKGAVGINPSLNPDPTVGSNCHFAVALPGGKTLMLGSTGLNNNQNQAAVFAVLNADGALDPAYGGIPHVLELGLNGNDRFWGGAVSGTNALVVGWQGGAGTLPLATDDEAFAILIPLQ